MTETEIQAIIQRQRGFFRAGKTLPISARLETLEKLEQAIRRYEEKLCAALHDDLGKPATEGFMTEVGLCLSEISYVKRHLRRWASDRTVPTPLANFPAHSFTRPMPYGAVLVMSPWNYPCLLSLEPLIDALSAGNTVVLKPSAYSAATGAVLKELLENALPPELCAVVAGGRKENQALLEQPFDYIFFTGSQAVGREVLRHAAERLTPVTLELGGKSPCIVERSAKLKLAARRIVFGKFLNCGQTCVAPDYVLCERAVKDDFIRALAAEIRRQIGDSPFENPQYGHIVNEKHFRRVLRLIDPAKVVVGGQSDAGRVQIAPTVMDNVTWEDAVMGEEIFGPVLPVLAIDRAGDAIEIVNSRPKPLAFYVFTQDRRVARRLTTACAFGGGCVNDAVVHIATSHMGFGGVGESGMGAYHGKAGFDAFSHVKSVTDRKTFLDPGMRYRPYGARAEKLIRFFLR